MFLFRVIATSYLTILALYAEVGWSLSASALRMEQEAIQTSKQRISQVLNRYCGESCELINVSATVEESSIDSEEFGFEGISAESPSNLQVSVLGVDLQVDDRISTTDRDRLTKLLTNSLRSMTPNVQINWSTVSVPQIGVSGDIEDRLKQIMHQKITSSAQGVLDGYCASDCILTNVSVAGRLISPDDARGISEKELVRDRESKGILRLDGIDVDISVDSSIDNSNQKKILNLIKARTKYAYPVNVNLSPVDFPVATQSKKAEAQDPWGLERLRQTLQIFRDLAGTKEIITSTNNSTNSVSDSKSNSVQTATNIDKNEVKELKEVRESRSSKELSSSMEKNDVTSSSNEVSKSDSALKSEGTQNYEYAMYIGAFILLAGIVVALIMRFSGAAKDARFMMEAANATRRDGGSGVDSGQMAASAGSDRGSGQQAIQSHGGSWSGNVNEAKLSTKFKLENIRDEILRIFMENPKVAKDVFTRMLQEDGVDLTSKYVYIFGPMVVFELIQDPGLQRDIHDLSEYYHKSSFSFSDDQTLELLSGLKTKITASEIKLLSRKRAEQFDFLQNLDAPQIYMLINEEKTQIQGIVLTQLNHQRRRAVFDMYEGPAKVSLMRELSKSDAIPKEYLSNVAKALHRKVMSRSEFDTEQLRSSDVLFDLLEKSPLLEQRALMADLVRTNPESARAIKLKLVTVEMLPYLKDGHLLELVMGLERSDLLAFLVGTADHIRDLLLGKAPRELASSWVEDIEQMTGVEEATYRLAELKILNRLRTLANNGAIRLLDINDRIFSDESLAEIRRNIEMTDIPVGRNSMAA
ncbi:MAG: hypothetical protein NT027_17815 [Proteobacteria bacterium]|nr:hypothetical protein [Pseudomonadota bacterium]